MQLYTHFHLKFWRSNSSVAGGWNCRTENRCKMFYPSRTKMMCPCASRKAYNLVATFRWDILYITIFQTLFSRNQFIYWLQTRSRHLKEFLFDFSSEIPSVAWWVALWKYLWSERRYWSQILLRTITRADLLNQNISSMQHLLFYWKLMAILNDHHVFY